MAKRYWLRGRCLQFVRRILQTASGRRAQLGGGADQRARLDHARSHAALLRAPGARLAVRGRERHRRRTVGDSRVTDFHVSIRAADTLLRGSRSQRRRKRQRQDGQRVPLHRTQRQRLGELRPAEANIRQSIALRSAQTPNSSQLPASLRTLGLILRDQNRLDESVDALEQWTRRHCPAANVILPALGQRRR